MRTTKKGVHWRVVSFSGLGFMGTRDCSRNWKKPYKIHSQGLPKTSLTFP